jgi:DNA adenine methylase
MSDFDVTFPKPITSPCKIFGGAFYRKNRILPLIDFSKCEIFVDGFLGGANILLNVPLQNSYGQPIMRIGTDINPDIIHTFSVIRDYPNDLSQLLSMISYNKETFEAALKDRNDPKLGMDKLVWAANFLVRNRMSRGANGKTYGWSDRLRRGKPEYISAWETMIDSIPIVSKRLRYAWFGLGDFVLGFDQAVNEKIRSAKAVRYLDPPFVHSTRVSTKVYDYEMSDSQHEKMLNTVLSWPGISYISGYHNEIYDDILGAQRIVGEWQIKNSASQRKHKPTMTEVLWRVKN